MPYFKRAAVYLAIGQVKKALPDLDKTVELKRDFHQVGIRVICVGSHACSSLYCYADYTRNDVVWVAKVPTTVDSPESQQYNLLG